MPTYDYRCRECGEVFEVFQSITASPLRKADCESCGQKTTVQRLIGTGGAVIFKGSGFYQTDYRSEGYKNAAKAEKETKDKSDAGSAKEPKDGKAKSSSSPDPGSKDSKTSSKDSRSKSSPS